jgi:AcrR family transcriptional regulator
VAAPLLASAVAGVRHPKARTGGRSARVVERVLGMTLEALGHEPYSQLRIEQIAARAGVTKTTIYRRWPTRAELVVAALTGHAAPPHVVETGRLEDDLLELFLTATTLRNSPEGRGVVSALIAERGDPEVDRVCAALREAHRAPARVLLERARRRGALPRRADIELLLDVLTGAVYGRLRECAAPLEREWVRRVIRLVLSGVAAGGTRSAARS